MNSAPCGSSGSRAPAPRFQLSNSFTPPPLWKIITIWNPELHSSLSHPNQSSQSIKWKVVDYFASHALKRDGMAQLFSQHAFMVVVDSFSRIDPHPDYYATRHGVKLYPMIDYVQADETDWELVLYAEINQLLVPGLVKHPASKLVILGGQLDCDQKQIVVNCKGTKIRTWLIHVVGDDTGKIIASPSNLGSHTGAPYGTPVKPDKFSLNFTQLPSVNGKPEMFLEILPCHTDKFFSIAELNTKLVNGCQVVSRPGGAGAGASPPKNSKVKLKSKSPPPSSPESQSPVPNSFHNRQNEESPEENNVFESLGISDETMLQAEINYYEKIGAGVGSKDCSEESTGTTHTEPVGVAEADSAGILDQSFSLLLDTNDSQSEESINEALFGATIPAPTTITNCKISDIPIPGAGGVSGVGVFNCKVNILEINISTDNHYWLRVSDSTVPPIDFQQYDYISVSDGDIPPPVVDQDFVDIRIDIDELDPGAPWDSLWYTFSRWAEGSGLYFKLKGVEVRKGEDGKWFLSMGPSGFEEADGDGEVGEIELAQQDEEVAERGEPGPDSEDDFCLGRKVKRQNQLLESEV